MSLIVFPVFSIFLYFLSSDLGALLYFRVLNTGILKKVYDTNYYQIDSLSMFIGIFLLSLFIIVRSGSLEKINTKYINFSNEVSSRDIKKSLILLLGAKGLINLWFIGLETLSQKLYFVENKLNVFQNGAGTTEFNEPYIFIFLSVVLLGPIVEEMIFRGIILNEIKISLSSRVAIVVSSITFAVFHWDFIQITYTLLMGLLLGYLYVHYKSFYLVCLLHIINNFLETLPPALDNSFIPFAIYFVSIICILPAYYIFKDLTKEKPTQLTPNPNLD